MSKLSKIWNPYTGFPLQKWTPVGYCRRSLRFRILIVCHHWVHLSTDCWCSFPIIHLHRRPETMILMVSTMCKKHNKNRYIQYIQIHVYLYLYSLVQIIDVIHLYYSILQIDFGTWKPFGQNPMAHRNRLLRTCHLYDPERHHRTITRNRCTGDSVGPLGQWLEHRGGGLGWDRDGMIRQNAFPSFIGKSTMIFAIPSQPQNIPEANMEPYDTDAFPTACHFRVPSMSIHVHPCPSSSTISRWACWF